MTAANDTAGFICEPDICAKVYIDINNVNLINVRRDLNLIFDAKKIKMI